jgi:hypothetical protein
MDLSKILKTVDGVMTVVDSLKGSKAETPPDVASGESPAQGFAGALEARLANVLVAALKEAFDRDHARLEMERTQLEEQRRHAETMLRMEARRQAIDRESSRLRLLGIGALAAWIFSVLLLVFRAAPVSGAAQAVTAGGWLLLLGAIAVAFHAQSRIAAQDPASEQPVESGAEGGAALWLLLAGLALSSVSMLL